MKKFISLALVAALVATSAFAAFSGEASVSFGYDTTSKAWGFANGKSLSVSVDIASEAAEKVAEGDIYAGIKASMEVGIKPYHGDEDKAIYNDGPASNLGIWAKVSEAYVTNGEWKVSILGSVGAPDYAKSAIDFSYSQAKDAFGVKYGSGSAVATPKSYKLPTVAQAGVTATMAGYKVGLGLVGKADDVAFNVFAETAEYEVAEGAKVQAAAIVANGTKKVDDKTVADTDKIGVGASVKASYATDAVTVKAAADLGVENVNNDAVVNLDTAVAVAVEPVTVDVYFSKVADANYLSAQVAADLEVVSGDVYVLDILGDDITVGADVEYPATEELTVSANVEMTTESQDLSVSANVKYAAEKFTAKCGVAYGMNLKAEGAEVLSATASVETKAIIPGATLSLSYGKDSAGNTMNFLADKDDDQNFGAVTAKCTIAF